MKAALALLMGTLLGQQGIPDVKQFVQEYAGFSKSEAAKIDTEVVVKQLDVEESSSELAIVGVVHIDATPAQAVTAFRNIETYLKSDALQEIGKFSKPPKASDLAAFTFPKSDIDAFKECNAHECKVKLGENGLEQIGKIDWSSPGAQKQADERFRKSALAYVEAYEKEGNRALIIYADKGKPTPLAADFDRILRQQKAMPKLEPELFRYLKDYPADPPPGLHSFVYWAVEDYGYRPTIMLVQAIVFERSGQTILGQKTIYASHYFLARFEITAVVAAPQGGSYLLYSDRSVFDDQLGRMQRSLLGRGVTGQVEKRLEAIRKRAKAGAA